MNLLKKVQSYIQQLDEIGCTWPKKLDVLMCTFLYGASPNNYQKFGFVKLNAKQRASYVTHRLSRKMIRKFNDPKCVKVFEDKRQFAVRYAKYFKRKWLDSSAMSYNEFLEFFRYTQAHEGRFICKPVSEAQGRGISVFHCSKFESGQLGQLYNEIKEGPVSILEEWIPQHQVIAELYPDAVNCLRIITVNSKGKTHFLAGGLTIGTDLEIANASASGCVAPVNFETGVLSEAADFSGHVYFEHPRTGRKIKGIQIPFWSAILNMISEAATMTPGIAYVGWDIAITPDGPCIIEGNTTPGYAYYQIPAHMPDGMGNKAQYCKWLREA